MKRRTLLQATPLLLGLPAAVQAQAPYPNKAIRYIVPVAAGGGSDMIGRTFCERLGKVLNQTVVVDNQSGGGGVIASQATARAAPDGYTLMQGYVATHATAPATRKLAYDPIKDFTPIGMIGSTPNVLVVNAALPVTDVKSFIDYLRKNMGKVSYGSAGAGSLTHLTAELFKAQTNTFMVHIPYRGIAPATTDLIAGQTQAMFPGLAAALPHIRNGRLRALAVTGSSRLPFLPDVPTLQETVPGFQVVNWYGLAAPAGTPKEALTRWHTEIVKVMVIPEIREKMVGMGTDPVGSTPEEFAQFMKLETAKWSRIIRDAQIRPD